MYKNMVCDCFFTAYSDFFNESFLCSTRNFDCDCDTYGSHIMLASFCVHNEGTTDADLRLNASMF